MANKKPDAAKPEVVAKPKYKVRLCIDSSNATIYRPDMPYLIDNKEDAVRWLAANGYKAEEIGVEGEKPANWDTVFSPPVVVPEPVPVAETPVVSETVPVAETPVVSEPAPVAETPVVPETAPAL